VTAARSFLVGLIGAGIQASLTPAMHEREGARHGLRYVYRRIDLDVLGVGVEALPRLLDDAEREGFSGLNITYPCKQAVIPYLDELSDDARAIGAVNTVVFRAGRRIGHNTDCSGFAMSLRAGLADAPRGRVVQLGAGGAGAAVAHAALGEAVRCLVLSDPDVQKAGALAAALCARFGAGRSVVAPDLAPEMARADGLIHATPTGMVKHPGLPLPAALLRPSLWVAEIVYFPIETELLRVARQLGCRTVDGSSMAVYQAVYAFELFTGIAADAVSMRRDFDQLLMQPRS
jgi:shikimate dehydrogenase